MGCSHSSVVNQVRYHDNRSLLQHRPQHDVMMDCAPAGNVGATVSTAVARFHERVSHARRKQRWEAMDLPNPKYILMQYRDLRPEDFELLCELDEGIPRKGTLPAGIVAKLPRTRAMDHSMTECRVCLAGFSPDAAVVQLPCRHVFHAECASRWLEECKGTCPICGLQLCDACVTHGLPNCHTQFQKCNG